MDRCRAAMRLLLACALAACLGGCVATPTPEPVTIRFGFQEYDQTYFKAQADAFQQANPYITVELVPHSWGEVSLLKADDADAFMLQLGYPLLDDHANLLPLDTLIDDDRGFAADDFYPGLLDLTRADGKTWGIPAGIDVNLMYYNRDLFDATGTAYPQNGWTWDDFLVAAQAVTDADNGVFGFVAAPQSNAPIYFVYQHGGRVLDDWANPTRVTLDDPLTIEAVEWYADLINMYGVLPTTEQAQQAFGSSAESWYRAIVIGHAGLWIGGFSERGGNTWGYPWECTYGMVALPREATAATTASIEQYVLSATTKHAAEAWRWLSFLSQHLPNRLAPPRQSLL